MLSAPAPKRKYCIFLQQGTVYIYEGIAQQIPSCSFEFLFVCVLFRVGLATAGTVRYRLLSGFTYWSSYRLKHTERTVDRCC